MAQIIYSLLKISTMKKYFIILDGFFTEISEQAYWSATVRRYCLTVKFDNFGNIISEEWT